MKTVFERDICNLIAQNYNCINVRDQLRVHASVTPGVHLYFVMRPHWVHPNDEFQSVLAKMFAEYFEKEDGLIILTDLQN